MTPVTMTKITLLIIVSFALSACARQPARSVHVLYETGFDARQTTDNPFPGWEPRINHGYLIEPGSGRSGVGLAMTLIPSQEAKAVMLSGKMTISQQHHVRLSYAGHLKTTDLVGEGSLFMRVFAGDELIFQDDLKGYALSGDHDWTRLEVSSPMLSGATEVEYGVVVIGTGRVSLDDVTLIMNTDRHIHPEALEFAHEALEQIKQNSLYDISPQVSQKYMQSLAGAQQTADVYGSIVSLLSDVGDQHAKFIPAAIRQQTEIDARHAKQPGHSSARQNLPVTIDTPQGIGYIRVPAFKKGRDDEGDYVAAGQRIAQSAAASASCGWIIDLRNNTGGSMWPMLAVLEPWLSQEVVGYMHMSDQSRETWQVKNGSSYLSGQLKQAGNQSAEQGAPKTSQLWPGPAIAVLIDGDTGSSGEAAAMAFKGQHNVTFIGQQTSGLTTGISQLELSDGSLVRLAIAEFLDRNGQAYPDGVPADVVSEDALQTAYDILGQQPGCGG
jgi:carboxyl-terminal processing protease